MDTDPRAGMMPKTFGARPAAIWGPALAMIVAIGIATPLFADSRRDTDVSVTEQDTTACFVGGHGHLTAGGYIRLDRIGGDVDRIIHNGAAVAIRDGFAMIGFNHAAPIRQKITIWCNGRGYDRPLNLAARHYQKQHIDLPDAMVTPPKGDWDRIAREAEELRRARRQSAFDGIPPRRLMVPTKGVVSGVYGSRRILNGKEKRPHLGLDIAAERGRPVRAGAAGIVTLVADMFYNGKTVLLDHGRGMHTIHTHLDRIHVTEGKRVGPGDLIGDVGATGRATGPHLHWGVSLDGLALDPAFFLTPPSRFEWHAGAGRGRGGALPR